MSQGKPRVFLCMPTYGGVHGEAAMSHFALPTRGECQVIPGFAKSSALCYGFNRLWAQALNWAREGMLDYWCLHHADVEVKTHGWLDIMVAEMRRTGAAVLSVVQPIKADGGHTSTALETGNPWGPYRLTLADLGPLPATFSAADCAKLRADCKGPLLVNTGLMLVDLARPEWREIRKADGSLVFHFNMEDQVYELPSGDFKARFKPEDWNFSRACALHGLPVYATTLIDCLHWGELGFPNRPVPAPEPAPKEEPVHAG